MKALFFLVVIFGVSAISAQDIYSAIATVESRNNDFAIGDNGRSIGRYQITKIYVDDVNRIAGTRFTCADRNNPQKSRKMVEIYLAHYSKRYTRLTGKPVTDEVKARIHNGGPDGFKKHSTVKYWHKVKKVLEK